MRSVPGADMVHQEREPYRNVSMPLEARCFRRLPACCYLTFQSGIHSLQYGQALSFPSSYLLSPLNQFDSHHLPRPFVSIQLCNTKVAGANIFDGLISIGGRHFVAQTQQQPFDDR